GARNVAAAARHDLDVRCGRKIVCVSIRRADRRLFLWVFRGPRSHAHRLVADGGRVLRAARARPVLLAADWDSLERADTSLIVRLVLASQLSTLWPALCRPLAPHDRAKHSAFEGLISSSPLARPAQEYFDKIFVKSLDSRDPFDN